MFRTLIIHRKNPIKTPFTYGGVYTPPNDDAPLDATGNTIPPIPVPVKISSTSNVNDTIVWAGVVYKITKIDTNSLQSAFNLPYDTNDPLLSITDDTVKEPLFSVNIEAQQVSNDTTSSSIPYLIRPTLQISIPVYSQEDVTSMGFLEKVEYPSQNRWNLTPLFQNDAYGYVQDDIVFVIPKTVYFTSNTSLKKPWPQRCPKNPSSISQSMICRSKNTNGDQGYNHSRVVGKFGNGNSYDTFSILRFRIIPTQTDTEDPIANAQEDSIPVEVTDEQGNDVTVGNQTQVPDSDITTFQQYGAIGAMTLIVFLALGILFTGIHSIPTFSILLILVLSFATLVLISSTSFIQSSSPFPKIASYIFVGFTILTSIVALVLQLFQFNVSTYFFILILFYFSVFTLSFNTYMKSETNEQILFSKISTMLSTIPKIIIVGLLFFQNPLATLLNGIRLISDTIPALPNPKGSFATSYNNVESESKSDGGISNHLDSSYLHSILQSVENTKQISTNDGGTIQASVFRKTDSTGEILYKEASSEGEDGGKPVIRSLPVTRSSGGYSLDGTIPEGGFKNTILTELNLSGELGIFIGFAILSSILILATPTYHPEEKDAFFNTSKIVDIAIHIVLIIILLFGWLVQQRIPYPLALLLLLALCSSILLQFL